MSRAELEAILRAGDRDRMRDVAREQLSRVLRFLMGRLYSDDRSQAVAALGWLAADHDVAPAEPIIELMRRFVWALNDESGAVPFGIPEAMGEIMLARPELRSTYLPILCSMLTSAEMVQTGDIERGVIWALGRVGSAAAEICPEAMTELRRFADEHDDPLTRRAAADALEVIAAPV